MICAPKTVCHPRVMSRSLPHLTLTTSTSSLSPTSSNLTVILFYTPKHVVSRSIQNTATIHGGVAVPRISNLPQRTWFPSHKTVDSEGSKRGVFCTTADDSRCQQQMGHNWGKWPSKWPTSTRRSGSIPKKNGNRVVFDTSGSYIENKMTKGIPWLLERDGVYAVDMMVAPWGREPEGQTAFWEAVHVVWTVTPLIHHI